MGAVTLTKSSGMKRLRETAMEDHGRHDRQHQEILDGVLAPAVFRHLHEQWHDLEVHGIDDASVGDLQLRDGR